MKIIKKIKNLKNKRVLVRVDFNVPMKNGKVEDDFRIRRVLPTIKYLANKGAKVILVTHLGKGGDTLAPVAKQLNKYIKNTFVSEVIGSKATEVVSKMKSGDVVLLENLRNNSGEQSASKLFALELSKLGDVYVNESFSVDHRGDASIVLLPKLLPAYAGLQLELEIKNLTKTFKNPKHPFLFILGGAKFSTKMPLIKKFLLLADSVFIGGALLNDFLKVEGYEVGKSLIDEQNFSINKLLKNKKLILPTDVFIKNQFGKFENKKVNEISKNDITIDIGSESIKKASELIANAKMILWNGPMGKYEIEPDKYNATKIMLRMVAKSKAFSVIGGGDTVDLISEMKMEKDFNFVSTGGGAMLEFLAKGTLPGIKALK